MKPFRYVDYIKINMKLDGILHVGDGDEDGSGLAENADGEYIMPAAGIAGAIRHALIEGDMDPKKIERYFGAKHDDVNKQSEASSNARDSRLYFYDAVCEDAYVEKRTGVKINEHLGVAEDKKLFQTYYLANGMTASLRIQIFAADNEEVEGDKKQDDKENGDKNINEYDDLRTIINSIVENIANGRISFGAKTRIGAGRFNVTCVEKLALDLKKPLDLEQYLKGIESCFEACIEDDSFKLILDKVSESVPDFRLVADIPDGLLVKSGEPSERADSVNMSYRLNRDTDKNASEYRFFIPGSSIKGVFRSYAESICRTVFRVKVLDQASVDDYAQAIVSTLFGSDNGDINTEDKSVDTDNNPNSEEAIDSHALLVAIENRNVPRIAGKIIFNDVPIEKPLTVLHSRVKIDRWLGGAIETAKMSEELVSTKEDDPIEINIWLSKLGDEKLEKVAKAILFLTCRDLARGRIAIGSGSSEGLGRLHGQKLTADGVTYLIKDGVIGMSQEEEKKITEWLNVFDDLCNTGDSKIKQWWGVLLGKVKGGSDGTKKD